MKKAKQNYPEIEDIRDDLDSLKTNVVELTKHVKKDGIIQSKELKDVAIERLQDMKSTGKEQVKKIERRVKEKPAQSIAVAFAAGLAASFLLGRRG